MTLLGYRHQVVYLNSMHAPAIAAPRAPQSRDRLYVVFWREGQPAPDLEVRPLARCEVCGMEVHARQSWKRPDREPWGRYRAQYVYRCPRAECRYSIVEPYVDPAAAAIDWTLRGQRIGDRGRPLSEKTMARIRAGLARYAGPQYVDFLPDAAGGGAHPITHPLTQIRHKPSVGLVVPVEGREGKTAAPVGVPLRTQSTRAETALVVPSGGTWNEDARPTDEPFRARTAVENEGIAFIAELRGGSSDARPVHAPLATVTASGNHHMLVRHNSSKGDGGEMCTPATEPARTITTTGHQSIVGWPHEIPAVEDCTFRMLEPAEIQAAMAFRRDYRVLGTRREQVRQLGNAVTPPAAEWLIRAVVESLGGRLAGGGR